MRLVAAPAAGAATARISAAENVVRTSDTDNPLDGLELHALGSAHAVSPLNAHATTCPRRRRAAGYRMSRVGGRSYERRGARAAPQHVPDLGGEFRDAP